MQITNLVSLYFHFSLSGRLVPGWLRWEITRTTGTAIQALPMYHITFSTAKLPWRTSVKASLSTLIRCHLHKLLRIRHLQLFLDCIKSNIGNIVTVRVINTRHRNLPHKWFFLVCTFESSFFGSWKSKEKQIMMVKPRSNFVWGKTLQNHFTKTFYL